VTRLSATIPDAKRGQRNALATVLASLRPGTASSEFVLHSGRALPRARPVWSQTVESRLGSASLRYLASELRPHRTRAPNIRRLRRRADTDRHIRCTRSVRVRGALIELAPVRSSVLRDEVGEADASEIENKNGVGERTPARATPRADDEDCFRRGDFYQNFYQNPLNGADLVDTGKALDARRRRSDPKYETWQRFCFAV
jgi:hypothetical protein